jgi:hypothetical protein
MLISAPKHFDTAKMCRQLQDVTTLYTYVNTMLLVSLSFDGEVVCALRVCARLITRLTTSISHQNLATQSTFHCPDTKTRPRDRGCCVRMCMYRHHSKQTQLVR